MPDHGTADRAIGRWSRICAVRRPAGTAKQVARWSAAKPGAACRSFPDFASLHPGYGLTRSAPQPTRPSRGGMFRRLFSLPSPNAGRAFRHDLARAGPGRSSGGKGGGVNASAGGSPNRPHPLRAAAHPPRQGEGCLGCSYLFPPPTRGGLSPHPHPKRQPASGGVHWGA